MIPLRVLVATAFFIAPCGSSHADDQPNINPASPFRIGEGYAETPATCETVSKWIKQAPTYDGRFSMTIVGPIVASHWDGALAYLVMCDPAGVQIMCVTYAMRDVDPNTEVMMAGGYQRISKNQVVLDPCLATDLTID